MIRILREGAASGSGAVGADGGSAADETKRDGRRDATALQGDRPVFRLDTAGTTYAFRVTKFGHLEHLYYGARLADADDPAVFAVKQGIQTGDSVLYDKSDDVYSLDHLCLEWSDNGRGDYRTSPTELKQPDGTFASDFVYESHTVADGCAPMETLPASYGDETDCQTLAVSMRDKKIDLTLTLYYTVFPGCDVIARRAVLRNGEQNPVVVRRIMSMSVDLPGLGLELVTLDGGWIKEAHRHARPLGYGTYVNSSNCGASGNRHNPGFLLCERGADEERGGVYGFNLVYSGNHCGLCELSPDDLVRVQLGINPHCFEWSLAQGEEFETPEAVMTYSAAGFGKMSRNFHDFVNGHIVRGEWKGKERPVLLNDWEAYFFRFTHGKLIRLARRAKRAGAELFVLDDGWFGARNSDHAGLGDYTVNRKKLPWGLSGLSKRVHKMGLLFGVWIEPEMVNEDSDLYRAHPDWAVTTPGRVPCLGRNQLVLDLTNPAVRDYIVDSVGGVLDEAKIDYVKWDMNRRMSDACSPTLAHQGEFYHRYILGLYEILGRIFAPRPHILLESCGSGGKRFDLGMLCFSPQIWTSDDTDPIERLAIQDGLSLFYPLSAMGAHVSEAPHQQTLRDTPLSTRFNAACFGALGYELDLKYLSPVQGKEVREQIAFYKTHRRLFQYGDFYRVPAARGNKVCWQVVSKDKTQSVVGCFQTLGTASEGMDALPIRGLDPARRYAVETKPQRLFVRRFGGLVKHLLPFTPNPNGWLLRMADRHYALTDAVERFAASGAALLRGVPLTNQFIGTGYNDRVRMFGDYGSQLFVIREIGDERSEPAEAKGAGCADYN